MNNLSEGHILNERYQIHEKIGEGGMSVVYKATDLKVSDTVAIKVLKREFCYDDEFINRFKNEAMAAKRLSHPNIVSIYDMASDGDIHYIVMEHIEGLSLDELIKAKKKLPWKNALEISAQILSAVDHAHSHKVIHRDIKPLNIMITIDGTVKLTDFGIARAVSSATKSASNDSAGSVHYLSPEQVRGGYVDERSDVYSIGITMYEMVTGRVPFDGDSHVMIALKHIDGKIIPPSEVDSTVPYGVSDLIVLATRKETNRRFQSAAEMYEMVLRVMKNPFISFLSEKKEEKNGTSFIYNEADDDTSLKKDSEGALEYEKQQEKNEKMKNVLFQTITYVTAAAISALVIFFVISMYSNIKDSLKAVTIHKASSYVGMSSEIVVEDLQKQGFVVECVLEPNLEYPVGYVIQQSIEPGTDIEIGDKIVLTVAAEEGSFILDNYVGEDYKYVLAELELKGLAVIEKELNSAEYEDRQVIRTSPDVGSIVSKGDTVTIYRSTGPLNYYTAVVPDVVGKTYDEAVALITKNRLKVGKLYPEPSSIIDDLIYIATPTPTPTIVPTLTPTNVLPGINQTELPVSTFNQVENSDISLSVITDKPYNENNTSAILPIGTETVPGDASDIPTEMPTAETPGFITPEPTVNITDVPTDIPTDVPTEVPTETPTITIEPTEEPHNYASNIVAYQYPAAGTKVTNGESVMLYFYEDITSVLPRKTITFSYPEYDEAPPSDIPATNSTGTPSANPVETSTPDTNEDILNLDPIVGDSCSVTIEAYVSGIGNDYVKETVYQIDSIKKNKFPIKFKVPLSLNSEPTKVYIYLGEVGGTSELIQVINVYE